jgi:hypothetical protein
MGFLRKRVKVGPLRFNFSPSGVSVSTGITGLRFGVGPRGNWIRMGRGGLSYRAALSPAASDKYVQIHEAASQLASAKAWHIEALGKVYDKKYHAGASNLLQRKPTSITKAEPPFVKRMWKLSLLVLGVRHFISFQIPVLFMT